MSKQVYNDKYYHDSNITFKKGDIVVVEDLYEGYDRVSVRTCEVVYNKIMPDYKVLGVIVLERYKREIREGDEPRMILAERNSRGNRKYRYWSNVFLK